MNGLIIEFDLIYFHINKNWIIWIWFSSKLVEVWTHS